MNRALILLFLLSGAAMAHKLVLYAYPEGDGVKVEAYYSGGGPCKECLLLLEETGQPIRLNAQGTAFLSPPSPALLAVEDGEGHRAEFRVENSTTQPKARDAGTPLASLLLGLGAIALTFGGIFLFIGRKKR